MNMNVISQNPKIWKILPLKSKDRLSLTIRAINVLGDIVNAERVNFPYVYSHGDSYIYSKLKTLGLITITADIIDKNKILATPQGRNIIDSILLLTDLLIREL